jgi:hypothetical protein
MAKLIITRKKEYFNWATGYTVYLNKQEIATIASNEIKEIEIPEGTHTIFVKINWCGSQNLPITVGDGNTKTVSISANKFPGIIMINMSLMILTSILFREFIRNYIFLKFSVITIMGIALVGMFYYLTTGRNTYIKIMDDSERLE